MIIINNLNISFDRPIFHDANFVLYKNKINVLLGKSGSGKTTLFNELGLLVKTLHCSYMFNGVNLNEIENKSTYRSQKIGYVFQENHMLEKLTVKENMEFACMISGLNIDDEKIDKLLKKTETLHLKQRKIFELSGGERQRIAVAFALAKEPELLLLDEPTSFLDKDNCLKIVDILQSIVQEGNVIVFVATHDERIINDKQIIYQIDNNKIITSGISSKNELNNNLTSRDFVYYKKAISRYIDISKKLINKRLYFYLFIILTVLYYSISYSQYYKSSILNQAVNGTLEEVRIYYGSKEKYCTDSIYKQLSYRTIRNINEIQGIDSLIPFYEISATLQNKQIVLQTYDKKFEDFEYKSQNSSNIYISYSLLDYVKNDRVIIKIGDKEYNLALNGVLDKSYFNQYSETTENIVYIPYNMFETILIDYECEPLLYILKFNENIDFSSLESKIKDIDPELTVYSSVSLENLHLLNIQLLEGVKKVSIIFIILVFLMILYDKYKQITLRKQEFGLLFSNGVNTNSILKLLFIESLDYTSFTVFGSYTCNLIIFYAIYGILPSEILALMFLSLILFLSILFIPGIFSYYILKKQTVIGLVNN